MIRYSLTCDKDHAFESWFASAEAFERLNASGHIACSRCGSARVRKSLMAPAVRPARKATAAPETAAAPRPAPSSGAGALSTPSTPLEAALAELRRHLTENSDDVGADFATEARAMHLGETPHRPIHGEARPEEAQALIDEGVPVAPLPFLPTRRSN